MSPNRPETPYVGMPALRSYRPSVAPVDITGTTGIPGHISRVSRSIGAQDLGSQRRRRAAARLRHRRHVHRRVARDVARASHGRPSRRDPGSTRQFTFARASCGSAFVAWPPVELRRDARRAQHRVVDRAAATGARPPRRRAGSSRRRCMSAAICPRLDLRHPLEVRRASPSLSATGKSCCSRRASASASR